jgi:PAS domain-containing protein
MTLESTFATPDGLWIIDSNGRTVYANEDMAVMLGTTVADLLVPVRISRRPGHG